MSKMILVLYWHPNTDSTMRIAIYKHLHTLDLGNENNEIFYLNTYFGSPNLASLVHFDVIVLHTTLLCLRWSPKAFKKWEKNYAWVKDTPSIKIAIPQDEYDHSKVLDEWLNDLGVSVIFTNFDETYRHILYPTMHTKATFYYCYTGYIDEVHDNSNNWLPISERELDIIYRASNLPYWFGSHGQLKHEIADIVERAASAQNLITDISTDTKDTITGGEWYNFMASGKATIGTESGSSVLDELGDIQKALKTILKENPSATFDEVSQLMPKDWDSYKFFALSPRHFEAIKVKTCQILVEGDYGGVLKPNLHYIPIKSDFSDVDQAVMKLKDDDYIQAMVDQAYQDIYLSGDYTYSKFALMIDNAIETEQSRINDTISKNKAVSKFIVDMYLAFNRLRLQLFAILLYIIQPTIKYLKK